MMQAGMTLAVTALWHRMPSHLDAGCPGLSVLDGDSDPNVQRFCASMRELLDTATEQRVPILFV